jgi:hypothetical protein
VKRLSHSACTSESFVAIVSYRHTLLGKGNNLKEANAQRDERESNAFRREKQQQNVISKLKLHSTIGPIIIDDYKMPYHKAVPLSKLALISSVYLS